MQAPPTGIAEPVQLGRRRQAQRVVDGDDLAAGGAAALDVVFVETRPAAEDGDGLTLPVGGDTPICEAHQLPRAWCGPPAPYPPVVTPARKNSTESTVAKPAAVDFCPALPLVLDETPAAPAKPTGRRQSVLVATADWTDGE